MASSDLEAPGVEPMDRVDEIDDVVLPEPVAALADEYDAVVGHRDRYLWKWIYSLLPAFELSSVDDRRQAAVRDQKTVFTIFVTLLDDVAERSGDMRTFEALRRLAVEPSAPSPDRLGVDADVFELGRHLWETFVEDASRAPRYDAFAEVFEYDVRQSLNAMEYARVINDNLEMANLTGIEQYSSHNMVMFPYADVDLMHSPSFDTADLCELRELIWELQKLARIGNWLTTWERELAENDHTAGIVVYALQHGILSPNELSDPNGSAAVADRIKRHGIEERFVREWWRRYREISEREFGATSVDLDAYVRGMETVLAYHQAGRGRK